MSQENVEIVRGIYAVPDGITGAASDGTATPWLCVRKSSRLP